MKCKYTIHSWQHRRQALNLSKQQNGATPKLAVVVDQMIGERTKSKKQTGARADSTLKGADMASERAGMVEIDENNLLSQTLVRLGAFCQYVSCASKMLNQLTRSLTRNTDPKWQRNPAVMRQKKR